MNTQLKYKRKWIGPKCSSFWLNEICPCLQNITTKYSHLKTENLHHFPRSHLLVSCRSFNIWWHVYVTWWHVIVQASRHPHLVWIGSPNTFHPVTMQQKFSSHIYHAGNFIFPHDVTLSSIQSRNMEILKLWNKLN